MPEVVDDLIQRALHGRQHEHLGDERLANCHCLVIEHRLAVLVAEGLRILATLVVHHGLVLLHGEGVVQIVHDVLARGQVYVQVGALELFRGQLRQPPLADRLARGHQLDEHRAPCLQVGLDRSQEAGDFHRAEQMREEALLVALERALGLTQLETIAGLQSPAGVLTRDARDGQSLLQVLMNDLVRLGVGVVDGGLLGGEIVDQRVKLHPVIR